VFAYFELPDTNFEDPSGQAELATLLYKKLLGLELPYATQLPQERIDISPCKTNVFLWLNYLSFLAIRNSMDEFETALPLALEKLSSESKAVIRLE